jgi:DNA polymerase elongation subunit (family B)
MILKDVVNAIYSINNTIDVLFNDGSIINYTIPQLGYPYFYCNTGQVSKFTDIQRDMIVRTEPTSSLVLRREGFVRVDLIKVYVKQPAFVPKVSAGSAYTCEAHLSYLEKRLGADGIFEFAMLPERYAYVDIEEANGRINLIGYIDSIDWEYYPFRNVNEFLVKLSERKITTVLAWNGLGYDYGRLDGEISAQVHNPFLLKRWSIILKLDAMKLYAIYTQRNLMSLDKAAKLEKVGRKLDLTTDFDNLGWEELVVYNKNDVVIMKDIVETTGVLTILFTIANFTGLHPSVISATKMVDNMMMKFGRHNGEKYLLFDTEYNGIKKPYEGAYIMTPVSGTHENVCVLDLDHLYPSVIEYIDYKGGISRDVYQIVRGFVIDFNTKRAEAKKKFEETGEMRYDVLQKALKVLTNSIYGVFGNEFYRYYSPDVAEFITASARNVRQSLEDVVRKYGFTPIASDTDSVFVAGLDREKGDKLKDIVNRELYPFRVKVEKFFSKLIVFRGEGGKEVKKRYVGLTTEGELLSTGIELIRGEYPDVTKDIEEKVLNMILRDGLSEGEVMGWLEEEYAKFVNRPLSDLMLSKVVDLEKKYKSRTTVIKAFESLGAEIREIKVKKKQKGKEVDGVGYQVVLPTSAKLMEVSYFLTVDNEPIGVGAGKPLETYSSYVNYDFYWDKFVRAPLNKLFISIGWSELENKYAKPKKTRQKLRA